MLKSVFLPVLSRRLNGSSSFSYPRSPRVVPIPPSAAQSLFSFIHLSKLSRLIRLAQSTLPRVTMSASETAAAPQGVLVTAGKVHVPFKAELLSTIAEPRFQKRAPHLVGILATKKEDARSYAEVGRAWNYADGSLRSDHASRLASTLSCAWLAMPARAWMAKALASV